MSDSTQVIVDIEAKDHEAERLGPSLRAWLVGKGIVQPDPSDCTPGDGDGYAPGPRYAAVLAAGTSDPAFLQLATNGLCISIGRRVFDGGSNGIELKCVKCAATFEPGPEWAESVGIWYEGDDQATYACPSCGGSQRLPEWRGPWPWGFGQLALEFWNWPPLSDGFLREGEQHLGHRTMLVRSLL
jgi:hypothetical protein